MKTKTIKDIIIGFIFLLILGAVLWVFMMPADKMTFIKNKDSALGKVACVYPAVPKGDSMNPVLSGGRPYFFQKCFSELDLAIDTIVVYKKNSNKRIAVIRGIQNGSYQVSQEQNKDNLITINFNEIIGIQYVPKQIETYQNEKYNFSFEYDVLQYSVEESISRGGYMQAESDLITIKEYDDTIFCPQTVTIFLSPATLNEELVDLEFRITGETSAIKLDGTTATERVGDLTEHQPACGADVTEIVFEQNENVYIVRAQKDSDSLLNTILETFSF
ncbi:MAG: hypothetical protein ABID45_03325 [Patescibacteria group bacterium]